MTDKQFQTVKESLHNFLQMSEGDIFFKPEVFSKLDDMEFETLDWITNNLIISSLQIAIANHFPLLELVGVGEIVLNGQELDIKLTLKLKSEKIETEPRNFTITLER